MIDHHSHTKAMVVTFFVAFGLYIGQQCRYYAPNYQGDADDDDNDDGDNDDGDADDDDNDDGDNDDGDEDDYCDGDEDDYGDGCTVIIKKNDIKPPFKT